MKPNDLGLSPRPAANIDDRERFASVFLGGALAAYGLSQRSVPGLLLSALGGALAYRGTTGRCPVYQQLGISTRSDATPEAGAEDERDDEEEDDADEGLLEPEARDKTKDPGQRIAAMGEAVPWIK